LFKKNSDNFEENNIDVQDVEEDESLEQHEEDNKIMEVWLKARSVQPATKQKDKVKQIIEWGNMNNKRIVFIRE
jgi:hypothetical protein